jgi:hypothetical protein
MGNILAGSRLRPRPPQERLQLPPSQPGARKAAERRSAFAELREPQQPLAIQGQSGHRFIIPSEILQTSGMRTNPTPSTCSASQASLSARLGLAWVLVVAWLALPPRDQYLHQHRSPATARVSRTATLLPNGQGACRRPEASEHLSRLRTSRRPFRLFLIRLLTKTNSTAALTFAVSDAETPAAALDVTGLPRIPR